MLFRSAITTAITPLKSSPLLARPHLCHSANMQNSTILVSLDLSAASDTIDHRILLNRLESTFGISGTALQWITSDHINCLQYVKLGDSSSNHQALNLECLRASYSAISSPHICLSNSRSSSIVLFFAFLLAYTFVSYEQ